MNTSQITSSIWQGSAPTTTWDTVAVCRDFDVLVLCAQEHQPDAAAFPGVEVLHVPFDDSGTPHPSDFTTAESAALVVANRVRKGKRVLVTCWLGVNRSGLVTALSLYALTGMSGKAAVAHVKERRPIALRNPAFVAYVERLPAQERARRRR